MRGCSEKNQNFNLVESLNLRVLIRLFVIVLILASLGLVFPKISSNGVIRIDFYQIPASLFVISGAGR